MTKAMGSGVKMKFGGEKDDSFCHSQPLGRAFFRVAGGRFREARLPISGENAGLLGIKETPVQGRQAWCVKVM